MTETEQLVIEQTARWKLDPCAFMVEALDVKPEHMWPKMVEVAESVRDNFKTAVSACHSVSKTYTAPRIALWFLYTHGPATVVTTAPTSKQIEQQFWRELRASHANARVPLGGKLTTVKLDLQELSGNKWFALGFSTKPDTVTSEATAFQGYHNDNVLVIFDEAAGIMPQIWKAGQYLLTSEGGVMRWLAQGNPTTVHGDFAEAVDGRHGWNVINIGVQDTPNFKQGKEIIPGVAGRKYEREIRSKYGVNSNEYRIRVLGLKPDYEEGTFFGKELAAALEDTAEHPSQLGYYPHDERAKVYTVWDIGPTHTVIWFVQFIQEQVRIIDFVYDSKGLGLPGHLKILQERPYIYAQHFAPWDVGGSDNRPGVSGPNGRNYQTGKYLLDVARDLGFNFSIIKKYGRNDQYAAGRGIIPKCLFHKPLVKEGWDGLCGFRKKLNATLSTSDKPMYYSEPVKDWTEHIGSAFCGLAMVYQYELVIDHQRVGYPNPLRNHGIDAPLSEDSYNPLRYGLKAVRT